MDAYADWREDGDKVEDRDGLAAAQRAWEQATDRFDDLAGRLAMMTATTIDGVLAKARVAAYQTVGDAAQGDKISRGPAAKRA